MQNPFENLTKQLLAIEQRLDSIDNKVEKIIGKNDKQFYSTKEFQKITGKKYATILNHCKIGMIKARQDGPNAPWQIYRSELERYIFEATSIDTSC
jgi:hypothetical protein